MNDYVGGKECSKALWHFGHMPAFAVMCMSKVRLFYNNVAELRQILGVTGTSNALSAGSEHLNLQIPDLLAQRVAVDPQEVGSADLVAPGRRQRHGQERMLDLAQDPVIKPGRRQVVAEARKIGRQVPFDRRR